MSLLLTRTLAQHRVSPLATGLFVLTLLQGSSLTLSIGFRGPFANDLLITLVTAGWLFMYVMAIVGLIVSFGLNWLTWIVRYRLLLTCLTAGAVFSTSWSMDSALTLERSTHLVGSTLLALYLGFSLPLHRMLKISAVVLGLIMVTSAVVAIQLPSLGLQDYEGRQVWAGVLASKNTLGFWAAVSLLLLLSVCTWSVSTSFRISCLVFALFAALCLYQSFSATSLLALMTAGMVMCYLHIAFNFRLGLTAMLVLGLLCTGLSGLAFYYLGDAELLGRSGDLTGRAEVWEQTWQLILDQPLTGYGYGTIWFPTAETVWIQQTLTDLSWVAFHAHNGFLQVASEIGLPLTGLAVFLVVQQLVEVIYCQYQRQQPGVLFILGFMIALLLSNYSEARFLVNRDLLWIFFIALPVSMLQQITLYTEQIRPSGNTQAAGRQAGNTLRTAREKLIRKRLMKNRVRMARGSNDGLSLINYKTQNTHLDPKASSANESVNNPASHDIAAEKPVKFATRTGNRQETKSWRKKTG